MKTVFPQYISVPSEPEDSLSSYCPFALLTEQQGQTAVMMTGALNAGRSDVD